MRVSWVYVALLFVGAFGVRLAVVFAFRDIHEGPPVVPSNDDYQFNQLAINLVAGNGYRVAPERAPTSFRAPGFPFVLAGLYAIVGTDPAPAYVLFCVLGAAACVFTYLLAREVLTESGARITGVFAAIYLPHAYMASTFNSETVFVPCLTLGLWMFVRYVKDRGIGALASAGLALGFATLTRPGTLLLLPLLLLALAWSDYRQRTFRPMMYLLFPLLFLGVVAPWTYRNHEVHGKWILVATNGGTTFWGGNNDLVLNERKHWGYWVPNSELPHHDDILAAKNEVERDELEWRLGKDWVREHVTSMPLLEAFKFARLWWLPDYGEGLRWLRIVSYAPFFLLVVLFALRVGWRRDVWSSPWLVIHTGILAAIATALIFCGEPRYRDACMPVLMIYAVAGLSTRLRLRAAETKLSASAEPNQASQ